MARVQSAALEVVSANTAGRFAGGLLIFGSISTFATIFGHLDSPARPGDVAAGVLAAVIGGLALVAPWNRWGRAWTLVLLPGVFGLLALGNHADPDPYIAGIFFVVVAMWTGLCHRRFTTLALSPVIAACYWFPLAAGPHLPTLASSTVIITAVAVTLGELRGLLRDRLGEAQVRLSDAKERRFAALVQRSADVTMVFDRDAVITYVSPSVQQVLGYRPEEVQGMALADFVGWGFEGLGEDALSSILHHSAGESFDDVAEFRILHRDGRFVDTEAVAQDRLDDPDIAGIVVHIRDIHQRKSLERDLQRQAYHDELTGLPNRSLFRERLEQAVGRGESVTVVFVDLDGFKLVNDTAGHDRGDQVLRLVAQRFLRVLDDATTLARFGGDEFALLLPEGVDPEQVCQQLIATLEDPFRIARTDARLGASAGLAAYTGVESADDLIRNADTAMYAAKADRSTRIVWYEPAMRTRILERIDTLALLRDGLVAGDFVLHYQPAIDLATGRPCGAEALVRWLHPELGLVMPSAFIDVAEESGLIVDLGRWVLRTACHDAAAWQVGPSAGRGVAVNVSVRQFQSSGLVEDVRETLASSGLDPRLLTIEITESVLIADIDAAASRLAELSELGVQLALDDFGTGYSSLSYLQRLPFDMLKIDKSFIDQVTTERNDLALVRTINRLGHDLGLLTLVEGIETPAQAAIARTIGCDQAQGFFYGRPVPIDDLLTGWSRSHDAPYVHSNN